MSRVENSTLSVAPRTPIDAPAPRRHRRWDDVPLGLKVGLLITVAAVGGVLIGMVESALGYYVFPLSLGISLLTVSLLMLARHWVTRPFELLLQQSQVVVQDRRPSILSELPMARQDEIGQLARIMHQLTIAALRDHQEANRLRRTLDHRVEKATRQATQQLLRMAMRDPLTDLGNRRFLEENLEPLVKSIREAGSDLIALIIDLDNFKQVNDRNGHAAGDELLIFLANLIRASVRREDLAVRWGGDEFVLIMPACTVPRAQQFADQLRQLFAQHIRTSMSHATDHPPGLSIGIASLNREAVPSGRELLARADAVLYDAKKAGKGCVVISGG